ncbi:MAG: AMP-binding protein, partial [Alphaproteobacteria bacterium]|nr:AMP-binding protein [Alphaproteobacteria bacterium]
MVVATVAAASGEEINPLDTGDLGKPIFHALVDARAKFGGSRPALVDGDERVLSYDDIVRGALALGHALKKGTRQGEVVGVMLPTGAASVVAFFALSAYGRVPAMLNFTGGSSGVTSAIRTAKVRKVITAHRFVDIAKLDDLIAETAKSTEIIYLEDVRDGLSLYDKAFAAL